MGIGDPFDDLFHRKSDDADLRIDAFPHGHRRKQIDDLLETCVAESIAFAGSAHQIKAFVPVVERGLDMLLEPGHVEPKVLGPRQHACSKVALRIASFDLSPRRHGDSPNRESGGNGRPCSTSGTGRL